MTHPNEWKIIEEGDDLLVCRGEHEWNDPCDFKRYSPAEPMQARIDDLEAENKKLLEALSNALP